MITSKHLIYPALAALLAAAGCSKDDQPEASAGKTPEIPASFTEAREKGMLDVNWRAELEKARKETSNPVIKINTELAAAEKKLAAAKAAKADEGEIKNLEKQAEELREKAKTAETKRRRAIQTKIRERMIKDFADAEDAIKKEKNVK